MKLREGKVHPLLNILKFFNSLIHIIPQMSGKISHEFCQLQQSLFSPFSEPLHMDIQDFHWKIG